ncbi:hypothetical protein MGN01_36890 [Methylobacterium gnaphalii]|uniref:Uncharacterized protein n=1 Tax=Methylobacterium gnaphalii TaxID=1010610 RepID=A0A512JPF5_9HYPH|nr:hypothetical protein MGN01_36890 [Methylobacterium gnaphalii]GLS47164.1 hypothetical protein GCM10007885_00060 [Methylobacterium gnaphalii]
MLDPSEVCCANMIIPAAPGRTAPGVEAVLNLRQNCQAAHHGRHSRHMAKASRRRHLSPAVTSPGSVEFRTVLYGAEAAPRGLKGVQIAPRAPPYPGTPGAARAPQERFQPNTARGAGYACACSTTAR